MALEKAEQGEARITRTRNKATIMERARQGREWMDAHGYIYCPLLRWISPDEQQVLRTALELIKGYGREYDLTKLDSIPMSDELVWEGAGKERQQVWKRVMHPDFHEFMKWQENWKKRKLAEHQNMQRILATEQNRSG